MPAVGDDAHHQKDGKPPGETVEQVPVDNAIDDMTKAREIMQQAKNPDEKKKAMHENMTMMEKGMGMMDMNERFHDG